MESRMERLMESSARLSEIMLRNQDQMQENYRRIDENYRRIDENNRLIEQSQLEAWTLLQQLMQAVAVMQADIVRIDETHA